ncbi:MAG: peptidylprolyl isomerase [Pseudomonadota bacterium]|nr:peptidylprolyl isomerase [Pseudomonadota bacterium]
MRTLLTSSLTLAALLFSSLVFSSNALAEPVYVALNTNKGVIELELNPEAAPISVENFVKYVEEKHYDGTVFHRVIKNFMIQAGGFDIDMNRKATRAAIKNEAKNGLNNARGTIAMARTGVVDSATSQFFINVKDNRFLDHGVRDFGYAVFGRVTQGMDVVDSIAAVATGARDVPRDPIIIHSAAVIDKTSAETTSLVD